MVKTTNKNRNKKDYIKYFGKVSELERILFEKRFWLVSKPTKTDPALIILTEKWNNMMNILFTDRTKNIDNKTLRIFNVREEDIYDFIKNPKRKKFLLAKKNYNRRYRNRKLK